MATIFELFKDEQTFTVVGPGGETIPILFRSLDFSQNAALAQEMELIRTSIKHAMSAEDIRAGLMDQTVRMTRDRLTDMVLSLERPLVIEQADLAPGSSPDVVEAAKKEEEAAKRWDESRKAELEAMEDKELRAIIIDRQTRLLVNGRMLGEFMSASLVFMILDPETKKPLFSADAGRCQTCGKTSRELERCHDRPMVPIENFIGRVAPQVRDQLVDFRRQFTVKRDEKIIRQEVESPAFLPSGASPKKPDESPGETTEIPSTSPPLSPQPTVQE